MRLVFSLLLIATIISCSNNKPEETAIPAKPASTDAVMQLIKGEKYTTSKVALISPFAMDKENPYEWMDEMSDTTRLFKNYLKDRMTFSLNFINDTAVVMNDDGKMITGTFILDNKTEEEEKEGVKLRISYADTSMTFPGSSGPMIMTGTYPVAGADEKSLLLELPRTYNNRKVAALLKQE